MHCRITFDRRKEMIGYSAESVKDYCRITFVIEEKGQITAYRIPLIKEDCERKGPGSSFF